MRVSGSLLSVVALTAAACGTPDASPSTARTPSSLAETRAPSRPAERRDGARTHVLLERHDPASQAASYLPVTLGAEGATPGTAFDAPAAPIVRREGQFRPVAAHDGSGTFAVLDRTASGYALVLRAADGSVRSRLALDAAPDAVHVDGELVLLGTANRVLRAALSPGEAAPPVAIVERPEMTWKAFDLLARDGDFVVAIDDVVMPIYASSIRVDGANVEKVADFELPAFINGRYGLARYVRLGPAEGTLYALGSYGVMDGNGHDLLAMPFRDGRPAVTMATPVNATRSTTPPVVEEHVDRGTQRPTKLLAGDHFTEITGLDAIALPGTSTRVLLAAGDRGLLVLPGDFGPDTTATAVDVGGPCADVLVDGDRVFVLAGDRLVALDASLARSWEIALRGTYSRIVR